MGKTRYFWDPVEDNVTKEYDENGDTIARYTTEPELYGNLISQERDGATSYYHFDGQGSTLALTNKDGNITDEYTYGAFGEMVGQSGLTVNPFAFLGEFNYYTDSEVGDIYVRARTYVPSVARWLSSDLAWDDASVNSYCYCHNSPVVLRDPSGAQDTANNTNDKVQLYQKVEIKSCSGCGGFKFEVRVSIGTVKGFPDPRMTQYFLVQRICFARSDMLCDTTCDEKCNPVPDKVRELSCCYNEILGRVDLGSDRGILYDVHEKRQGIVDKWEFDSIGDAKCHSVGNGIITSRLYLVPPTDELARLYSTWKVMEVKCKDYTMLVGSGPMEIDKEHAAGKSSAAVLAKWDCCPKHPTEFCVAAKGQIREGAFHEDSE